MRLWLVAAIVALAVGLAPVGARPLVFEENAIKDPLLRAIVIDIVDNCNGWLDFGQNINMVGYNHTFTTVDTEETIDISSLGLEYIPTSFLQYNSTTGAYAYPSNAASWTATSIKAKATKAGAIVLVPFAAGPQ